MPSWQAVYQSNDKKCLIGGKLIGQTSRFETREMAADRFYQIVELNGPHCVGGVLKNPLHPEIFIHCGTVAQTIGGKCFGCGKVLTLEDAKKAGSQHKSEK